MIKQEMRAIEALNHIQKIRLIKPNDGFLKQISKLDNNLLKKNNDLRVYDIEKSSCSDLN